MSEVESKNLAFVFPGQGSQSVGMLAELAEKHVIIKETFAQASERLSYDLWELCQSGPAEKLNETQVTQPALLTSSVALWRLYQQAGGVVPAIMAGHSLGEYSALVCAGVLSLEDGVEVVQQRGSFMQDAVAPGDGAMAAILGLDDEQVIAACEETANDEVVSAVNFNAPGQVVIAGESAAVDRAIEACKAAGARKAMPLAVSAPSHCSLMTPAAERLAIVLDDIQFKAPEIAVINNVDVSTETSEEAIKSALVRQLTMPVRWVESFRSMYTQGISLAVECGPNKVLTGLAKRIEKGVEVKPLNDETGFTALIERLV